MVKLGVCFTPHFNGNVTDVSFNHLKCLSISSGELLSYQEDHPHGWRYSSVVEQLPSMHKALGSMPSTERQTVNHSCRCLLS